MHKPVMPVSHNQKNLPWNTLSIAKCVNINKENININPRTDIYLPPTSISDTFYIMDYRDRIRIARIRDTTDKPPCNWIGRHRGSVRIGCRRNHNAYPVPAIMARKSQSFFPLLYVSKIISAIGTVIITIMMKKNTLFFDSKLRYRSLTKNPINRRSIRVQKKGFLKGDLIEEKTDILPMPIQLTTLRQLRNYRNYRDRIHIAAFFAPPCSR
jgi:hypothetical protein